MLSSYCVDINRRDDLESSLHTRASTEHNQIIFFYPVAKALGNGKVTLFAASMERDGNKLKFPS